MEVQVLNVFKDSKLMINQLNGESQVKEPILKTIRQQNWGNQREVKEVGIHLHSKREKCKSEFTLKIVQHRGTSRSGKCCPTNNPYLKVFHDNRKPRKLDDLDLRVHTKWR